MSASGEIKSAQIVLVLADISGYTRFARLHRTSEAHAEHIICELLEEVIAATDHPLELHQLLGMPAKMPSSCESRNVIASASLSSIGSR